MPQHRSNAPWIAHCAESPGNFFGYFNLISFFSIFCFDKQNRRNLGDLSLMNEFSMRATLSDDAGNLRFNYLHADLYGAQTWAKLIRPIQKPPKKQYDFLI